MPLLTKELKQQKRQENKLKNDQLEKTYAYFNRFEIFKPYNVEFLSYKHNKQTELFNAYLVKFKQDKNSCSIVFNKSDLSIFEINQIISKCDSMDIRIQKYSA